MNIDFVKEELGEITEWTAGNIIARRAALHGDRIFLKYVPDGRTFTYSQLHFHTNGLAEDFQKMGVKRGDHVALLMGNRPEFILAAFALTKLGAVVAPINVNARGKLLHYYLDLCDAKALVGDSSLIEALSGFAFDLPKLEALVVLGPHDGLPSLQGKNMVVHEFPEPDPRAETAVSDQTAFSDLCYLMFTSGTTGPSKAIMMTHASVHFWGAEGARYAEYQTGDIEYVCMPLFHGNALLVSTTASLMAGTTVALTDRFSVSRFWKDIHAIQATRFNCIGAIANFLWSQPPSSLDRGHKVRICSLSPSPSFLFGFEERFGVKAYAGFGLTDYGVVTTLPSDAPKDKRFSNGRPRAGVQIRIVDDRDFDLPTGKTGEILLRGSQMWGYSVGYYKNPQATLEAWRNFWFHTGDAGYLDADGYLYFTGRIKDSIRRRGENISSYEVESVIVNHPSVEQVAVYPIRSELTEDEVAASVVLKEGCMLDHAGLIHYCAENMSYFMVPRYLEFVEELPLTPSSKVEKQKLRARAEADISVMWDRERAGVTVGRTGASRPKSS